MVSMYLHNKLHTVIASACNSPHCERKGPALQMAHSTHQDIQLQIEFADLDES